MVELSPDLRARVDAIKGRDRSPQSVQHSRHTAKPGKLTQRELMILELVAAGYRQKEIGKKLFISPETVRTHLGSARVKLSARTGAQAVAIGIREGVLIGPSEVIVYERRLAVIQEAVDEFAADLAALRQANEVGP